MITVADKIIKEMEFEERREELKGIARSVLNRLGMAEELPHLTLVATMNEAIDLIKDFATVADLQAVFIDDIIQEISGKQEGEIEATRKIIKELYEDDKEE